MAAGTTRTDAFVVDGIERWASQAAPAWNAFSVDKVTRPKAGWSNETLVLAVRFASETHEKLIEDTWVVRLAPLVASFPDYDIATQADVHRAATIAGVSAPEILACEHDPQWLDAPFLVMQFLDGRTIAEVPALDQWLTAMSPNTQGDVLNQFVETLATLHRCDLATQQLLTPRNSLRVGLDAEIRYWTNYLDWAADGAPPRRLVAALNWCAARAPAADAVPPSLLWGDARLGNAMYNENARLVGVLDWELASIGPGEMDLAWYLALDALTEHFISKRVAGFASRCEIIARYEQHLGRAVMHLGWHEVFAVVRSTAINDRQARIAARAGTRYPGIAGDENPVLDLIETSMSAWSDD